MGLAAVGALALSGVALTIAHIRPLGPLACLLFLVGAWRILLPRGGGQVRP